MIPCGHKGGCWGFPRQITSPSLLCFRPLNISKGDEDRSASVYTGWQVGTPGIGIRSFKGAGGHRRVVSKTRTLGTRLNP